MKKLILFTAFCVLLCNIAASAAKTIPILHEYQRLDTWCWAAVGSIAYSYSTGRILSDCDIATIKNDAKINCCKHPYSCNETISPFDFMHLLSSTLDLPTKVVYESLTLEHVRKNIDENKIIIAGLSLPDLDADHLVVINGYKNNFILYFDPHARKGSKIKNFNSLRFVSWFFITIEKKY